MMTTAKQKSTAAYWHYSAGQKYGGEIANTIVEQFPDGFDDTQCAQLATDTKTSLAEALKVIPKRHRDDFAIGYGVGLHAVISTRREQLILRAVYQDK